MTYRKTIEINHKHSLDEWEIIEVLNALSSQAAYGDAWRSHVEHVDGPSAIKAIQNSSDEVEYPDVVAFGSFGVYPPLSTPTPNNQ